MGLINQQTSLGGTILQVSRCFSRQEVLVQHASAPLPHGVTLGVRNSESTEIFVEASGVPVIFRESDRLFVVLILFSPKKMYSIYTI
jgi:hypothetical protein